MAAVITTLPLTDVRHNVAVGLNRSFTTSIWLNLVQHWQINRELNPQHECR